MDKLWGALGALLIALVMFGMFVVAIGSILLVILLLSIFVWWICGKCGMNEELAFKFAKVFGISLSVVVAIASMSIYQIKELEQIEINNAQRAKREYRNSIVDKWHLGAKLTPEERDIIGLPPKKPEKPKKPKEPEIVQDTPGSINQSWQKKMDEEAGVVIDSTGHYRGRYIAGQEQRQREYDNQIRYQKQLEANEKDRRSRLLPSERLKYHYEGSESGYNRRLKELQKQEHRRGQKSGQTSIRKEGTPVRKEGTPVRKKGVPIR